MVIGVPAPTLTWTKDGKTFVVSPDGSLALRNVGLNDEGIYVCTATNTAGRDQARVQLLVQGWRPNRSATNVYVDAVWKYTRNLKEEKKWDCILLGMCFFIVPPVVEILEPPFNSPLQERVANQRIAFPCPAKGTALLLAPYSECYAEVLLRVSPSSSRLQVFLSQ